MLICGLGGIDLQHRYIQLDNTYMYVRHTAAVHDLPVADLDRWSWGRWRVSESVLRC